MAITAWVSMRADPHLETGGRIPQNIFSGYCCFSELTWAYLWPHPFPASPTAVQKHAIRGNGVSKLAIVCECASWDGLSPGPVHPGIDGYAAALPQPWKSCYRWINRCQLRETGAFYVYKDHKLLHPRHRKTAGSSPDTNSAYTPWWRALYANLTGQTPKSENE